MLTGEVLEALRRRHPDHEGEWLTYQECWRIDLLAMRCWGTAGHRVGYEVKVSRSDFRNEIRKPQKRAHARKLVHEFYFACPEGLVWVEEIPEDCGLVTITEKGKVKLVKRSPVFEARDLTIKETIYLARWPLYRDGILALRQENTAMRGWRQHQEQTISRQAEQLRLAHDALQLHLGHLVERGARWVGTWAKWGYGEREDGVEVEVEEVTWYGDGSAGVEIRRLDHPELPRYATRMHLSVGEFLGLYRAAPLDSQLAVS